MNEWQLIIPMSGLGSRFVRAGYTDPKPLITLDGRRLIEWVLRMFPGAEDPLFICRREHIETTPMRSILTALRPKGRIVVIEGAKLGPVDALLKAEDAIPDNRPALVSYCDYYMHWNYAAFRGAMEAVGAAGAVPCYTGFHPHLMPEKTCMPAAASMAKTGCWKSGRNTASKKTKHRPVTRQVSITSTPVQP